MSAASITTTTRRDAVARHLLSGGTPEKISPSDALPLRNGATAPLDAVPVMDFASFRHWLTALLSAGCRITAFFAVPRGDDGKDDASFFLYAVVADDNAGLLRLARVGVCGAYPSLTRDMPALHLFERVIYEKWGLLPENHPWLKPVRFDNPTGPAAGEMEFYRIAGDEVHEVSVGPIHAGVIECGHFRFQCLGEEVLHLEISLGYHHRGVEVLLTGMARSRLLPLVEAVAGDSTVAHTWACCALLERLSGVLPTSRGQHLRALALELERLACHTGDLGAIAGDVGFLPTSAYCGRLRGDWLNLSAMLCGSRFSRSMIVPGGATFDVDAALARDLVNKTRQTLRDVEGAVRLIWISPSVMSRLTGIGILPSTAAASLGIVGMAARSSGLALDVRHSHALTDLPEPPAMCTKKNGDVGARAALRHTEVQSSAAFCANLLENIPSGAICAPNWRNFTRPLAPEHIAVALVESWRGEVCHVALTDAKGDFAAYAIVDPSFHNWAGLAYALRGQQISDFPLCNKSFNLSYCGHDL
ncbi:MAG: hydrogenase [Desulfovibrio sp.]|jgi:Ni,Fe-hydrogenase III large subunit|nr:hydrogenase [Desulfovibrio sp.]